MRDAALADPRESLNNTRHSQALYEAQAAVRTLCAVAWKQER